MGLVLLFSWIQAQLAWEPSSHYLTTPANTYKSFSAPLLLLLMGLLAPLQWGEDSRALLSQPSRSGTTLEKGHKIVSPENCLCAGVRGHCCLHMCVQTHLEWSGGMKPHLWNTTRHPADHRYSSGKLLRELVSHGLFCFLTEQSQGTAPNVQNKQEKKVVAVGVLLLFYMALLWRSQNKCKLCFSSSQISPWRITHLLRAPGYSSSCQGHGFPTPKWLCPKS